MRVIDTYKLCRALWEKHKLADRIADMFEDAGLLLGGIAESALYGYTEILDDVVVAPLDIDLVADRDQLVEDFIYSRDFDQFWDDWKETLCGK